MSLIVAEPPMAYGDRPRLVIDASVLAAALFAEPARADAISWMRGRRLCAPHLLDCEIANVAIAKVARKLVGADEAVDAIRMLPEFAIERHAIEPVAVHSLAARTRLTAYDAAYLWLARTLGAPLATFDARLGKAALEDFRDQGE